MKIMMGEKPIKIILTYARTRVRDMPNGRTETVEPDYTLDMSVKWAHVREGTLMYRQPEDPDGVVRYVPMHLVYHLVIEDPVSVADVADVVSH